MIPELQTSERCEIDQTLASARNPFTFSLAELVHTMWTCQAPPVVTGCARLIFFVAFFGSSFLARLKICLGASFCTHSLHT